MIMICTSTRKRQQSAKSPMVRTYPDQTSVTEIDGQNLDSGNDSYGRQIICLKLAESTDTEIPGAISDLPSCMARQPCLVPLGHMYPSV